MRLNKEQYPNNPTYFPRVNFITSTTNRENKQDYTNQINNQHLSTPPPHHRVNKTDLGEGRQFLNNPKVFENVSSNFPQTKIMQSSNVVEGYPYAGTHNARSNKEQYIAQQKNPDPNSPSLINTRSRSPNPHSIVSAYQQNKQQYVNGIKRLEDYVEINYPDGGKYIGQVLNTDLKGSFSFENKKQNQSPMVKNGQGIFFYPTGDVYFGGWKQDMLNGQGVYIFSTGEIYDGLLKSSLKDGTGTYYYENITCFYTGSWLNDLKHESGVLDSPEQYYEGQWKNGMKHGNGYFKNKINKVIYVGQYVEGVIQGKGRMVYPDGSVYAGQFRNQLPHGVGDFQYPNKDKYIGQFIEGKKHGKGNYFFSQGTIFSGLWKEDTKIQGELTLFNGDVFNGCFNENQRYQGIYRYRNGDVYEGTWKDDVKDGFGKLYLENGQKYQGKFVEGQKYGEGIYTWKNGDRYEGQFAYDKRQGLGQYYWHDGGIYKGQWKADRMNGFGRLIKDGVDIIGQFFADHFQRQIDQNQLGALRNFVLN